jgi:hypothetical protein
MRLRPGIPEYIKAFPAAFGARPVASRECGGLIQEEEFCVEAWRHHGALPSFEFQYADNPLAALELANDFALVIVDCATPVPHKSSTG